MPHKKTIAKATDAGKTNSKVDSLMKCEVNLESGAWVSPESCQTFYIDEGAKFPDITYEIKTDESGPYEWKWAIEWVAMACQQKDGKQRITPKGGNKTFRDSGKFASSQKVWKANLNAQTLGGVLTVMVKAGNTIFTRKTIILGKNPSEEKIRTELDLYTNKADVELVKKIITQESRFRQFYSDNMPLTSFDKGFGLGQLTNPPPSFEQVWSWKSHITEIMKVRIPYHRKIAKTYLNHYGNYTQTHLDMETLASYNGLAKGQHYYNWDATNKQWVVNENVMCDPNQSNKGWLLDDDVNKNKSVTELNESGHPIYTGKCYAEHIKNNQGTN